MKCSAASIPTASKIAYLRKTDRTAAQKADAPPMRFPWTDELEQRRRAVARWRGNETGLKETMMRE